MTRRTSILAFGDVQLGRQDRQLHRRVVRRRLPDDDQDRRAARRPARVQSGNMFFFKTRSEISCPSTATRGRRTTTWARPGGSRTAPRTSASRCRRGPLPAGQRVLPRRLLGDRLHRPDAAEGGRVRRPRGDEHLVGVHLSAQVRPPEHAAGVLERRPEPQLRGDLGEPGLPRRRYGFMRFEARVRSNLASASTA